jgi:hypothetical protein
LKETTQSLGEALPAEMARVRDEILPVYLKCVGGDIAAAFMRRDLDLAAKAMAEGDLPGMIAAYNSLKEYKL